MNSSLGFAKHDHSERRIYEVIDSAELANRWRVPVTWIPSQIFRATLLRNAKLT